MRLLRKHTGEEKWQIITLYLSGKMSEFIHFSYDNYKMNTHHNLGLYQCSHCIFSTSYEQNLKVHMRRHNPEKLFKCNQCNYEGNQRSILDSHIRSTHNNLWYHCELCEYKSSQKGNLNKHVQIKHEGLVFVFAMIMTTNQHRCSCRCPRRVIL